MKKGRSCYTFNVNGKMNELNQLVQGYISGNNYKQENKNGEIYYKMKDATSVERGFNYTISDNELIIYAWIKDLINDYTLEQTGITSMNILGLSAVSYRNSLKTLFQEIDKINNNNDNGGNMNNNNQPNNNVTSYDPNTGQPIYGNNVNNNQPMNNQPNNNIVSYDPNTGQPIYGNMNNNQQNFGYNSMPNYGNQFANNFQNETIKRQETMCEVGFWLSIVGLLISFVGVAFGVVVYILDFYFASQGLKTRKRGKAIATIVMSALSIFIIIFELLVVAATY